MELFVSSDGSGSFTATFLSRIGAIAAESSLTPPVSRGSAEEIRSLVSSSGTTAGTRREDTASKSRFGC